MIMRSSTGASRATSLAASALVMPSRALLAKQKMSWMYHRASWRLGNIAAAAIAWVFRRWYPLTQMTAPRRKWGT